MIVMNIAILTSLHLRLVALVFGTIGIMKYMGCGGTDSYCEGRIYGVRTGGRRYC